MKKLLPMALVSVLAVSPFMNILAEDEKAEEKVKPGVVVTSEDASQRCMLPLVVTAVDGKKLKDTQSSGRFEFEPGKHSVTGYGGGNPTMCASFAAKHSKLATEGAMLGASTLNLDVISGKEYFLAIDIRSDDPAKWKMVAWKIKH